VVTGKWATVFFSDGLDFESALAELVYVFGPSGSGSFDWRDTLRSGVNEVMERPSKPAVYGD